MSDFTFSRDDLLLLMKSYENTIQLNTTLLEQQKRVIDDQTKILNRLVDLSHNIDGIVSKQRDLMTTIQELASSCDNKTATVQREISESRVDSVKNHGSTKTRLTFVYGGLFTIVISLIGLLVSSYKYLPDILKIVEAIQGQLGIIP